MSGGVESLVLDAVVPLVRGGGGPGRRRPWVRARDHPLSLIAPVSWSALVARPLRSRPRCSSTWRSSGRVTSPRGRLPRCRAGAAAGVGGGDGAGLGQGVPVIGWSWSSRRSRPRCRCRDGGDAGCRGGDPACPLSPGVSLTGARRSFRGHGGRRHLNRTWRRHAGGVGPSRPSRTPAAASRSGRRWSIWSSWPRRAGRGGPGGAAARPARQRDGHGRLRRFGAGRADPL